MNQQHAQYSTHKVKQFYKIMCFSNIPRNKTFQTLWL